MPTFESFDGTPISYLAFDRQEDHTLFWLHGWTGAAEYYALLADHLKGFNLLFWDARCHGKTGAKPGTTLEVLARDFRHFVDHVYAWKAPLVAVGHSMGALVLLESIRQAGTRGLARIVFVDQSPRLLTDDGWRLGLYGHFTREDNLELTRLFLADFNNGMLSARYPRPGGRNMSGPQSLHALSDSTIPRRL